MKNLNANRTVKAALLGAALLFFPSLSFARDVSFVWTANPEPVVGYKLYYKTGTDSAAPYSGSGLTEGSAPIVVGNVTTYTVTGLSPSEAYQFVLTAYNDSEESGYSEVVTVEPGIAPMIIKIEKKS